jgi:hypothetical protein
VKGRELPRATATDRRTVLVQGYTGTPEALRAAAEGSLVVEVPFQLLIDAAASIENGSVPPPRSPELLQPAIQLVGPDVAIVRGTADSHDVRSTVVPDGEGVVEVAEAEILDAARRIRAAQWEVAA